MAITVTNRNYSTRNHPSGNDFLLANEGQFITEVVDFTVNFDFFSSSDLPVQIVDEFTLKLLGDDWANLGFTIGDSIDLNGVYSDSSGTPVTISGTGTITDLQNDLLTQSLSLGTTGFSQLFPSAPNNSVFSVINNTRTAPESIEVFHNLVLNDSQGSRNSLLDGEVNRFVADNVDSMSVSSVLDFEQLGNKSGGTYLSAQITRNADVNGNKSYSLSLEYDIPYKFDDSDFDEPSLFNGLQSLKPFYEINCLPETNNPNSALTLSYAYLQGNVGWYNENYNQGVNDFTLNTTFSDSSGNTLNELDYNQTTIVQIEITGNNPIVQKAEVQIYLIPPINDVKNNTFKNAENIYLSAFFANFDGVSVVENDTFGLGGANFITANHAVISSGNTTTITFEITPNAALTSFVESLSTSERLYRITANVEEDGGTNNDNNAVSLVARQSTLEKAEVVGGAYTTTFAGFYNHAQDIATGTAETVYNGCTEDDLMYVSRFNLDKGTTWKTLNLNIQVERLSDGSSFDLLTKSINLEQYVVSPDGTQNINYLENLTQYLEAPERNKLQIGLTGVNTVNDYEVEIIWSLLADWRYWVQQTNAFTDFYDTNLNNDGLNAEWVRYLELSGYNLRVFNTLVDSDNISYYFTSKIDLQDYDDEPTITSSITYLDDNGASQTALIAGQEMTIRAEHVLSSGTWDALDTWGWISQRPFENEPNKRISSAWDWTSQNSPLKPKSGLTKAELTFPNPATARLECLVDTNLINIGNFSVISRIESPKAPACIGLWDFVFDLLEGNSTDESQYIGQLDKLLAGLNVSKLNVCCPTCTADINGDSSAVEVFAFGRETIVDNYIATWASGEPCCKDIYETQATCEAGFDSTIDSIMLGLDGDTELLTDRTPTQINTYGNTLMTQLQTRLFALTTDEAIRYAIMYQLINYGIKYTCDENGNKIISSLVTPYIPSTQSMYKWTEAGVTKFTELGQPKNIE